jgi:hypothetical protein
MRSTHFSTSPATNLPPARIRIEGNRPMVNDRFGAYCFSAHSTKGN